MYQVQVSSLQAAVLLVDEDSGPALIINNDPNFNLWLGDSQATSPAIPQEAIPIAPNGYLAVDGKRAVYGIADPGTTTVQVFVIPGGMAFFQFLTQLVIAGAAAGIFIYAPVAGFGNLIGSWSAIATVDKYGNTVPAGINVNQGQLSGVTLTNANILSSIIVQAAIADATISSSTFAGGAIVESVITFDSSGGQLLMYSTTTTTVTQTANGTYNLNVPGNVSVGDVSCWGASAGASGGNPTNGGEGGGGGGFSRNPTYALIPGSVVTYQVGNGGTGGNTGIPGTDGEDTTFDTANAGVVAFGGQAHRGSFLGGNGGAANPAMPISFAGGRGGDSSGTASAGGGSSAGTTGNGNNGGNSSGTTPGGSGAAPTGGAPGGAGVAPATNGNNGGSPGGGGSGAGAANAATQVNKTYSFSASGTYYGSDATGGNGNGKKNSTPSDGTMYQGGETASGGSFNGTQKALGIISGNPAADYAGVTIDQVTVRFSNFHTWYNSGATLYIGHNGRTSIPGSWDGSDITLDKSAHIGEGATTTFDMSSTGLGAALKSGAAKAITLGPGSGGFNLNNYAGQYGAGGGSTSPQLVVKGHTTGTNVKAGNGQDGKVVIVYANTSAMLAALSPVAGTDVSGNAFGAGYTGPVQAFQPGVSPTVVETWHNVSLAAGWTTDAGVAVPQYRLTAQGDLQLSGRAHISFPSNAGITMTNTPLPTGYRPANAHDFRSGDLIGSRCHMSITTAGIINAFPPSGATFPANYFAELDAIIPLT